MDDDADCTEHVWDLEQIHITGRGADRVKHCVRCGAAAYTPGQAALRDTRPPL